MENNATISEDWMGFLDRSSVAIGIEFRKYMYINLLLFVPSQIFSRLSLIKKIVSDKYVKQFRNSSRPSGN